jgi:hypothetical protein
MPNVLIFIVAPNNMTLRKIITFAFVPFLCYTNSFGQGKQDKSIILKQIKELFRQVNDYKNYKVVTIDDTEEFLGHVTDNGGNLKGYFKGDSVKKIVEWVGLSNRVVQNDYYFDKGKLVFVYSTDKTYRFNYKTEEFDYSKFDKVISRRYYFNNDKLIETILRDKEHEKTKQEDAADFLSFSKNFIKLLNAKRK